MCVGDDVSGPYQRGVDRHTCKTRFYRFHSSWRIHSSGNNPWEQPVVFLNAIVLYNKEVTSTFKAGFTGCMQVLLQMHQSVQLSKTFAEIFTFHTACTVEHLLS